MAAKATPNRTDHPLSAPDSPAAEPASLPDPTAQPPVPQPSEPRSRARAWLLRIAGTLLFVVLLVWLDLSGALPLEKVWSALTGADFGLVALSIAFYGPFLVVKAARWRRVSAAMNVPLSWGDAWRIYGIGLAAGTFTPGQAGDALKAWYVQRKGYTLARGLGSSVLDRLFDVAGLAVLGLVGVLVYGGRFAGQTPVLVGWALACVAVVAFLAWNRSRTWAVNLVARRLARFGGGNSTAGGWSLDARTLSYAGLLTLASFAISIFRVWLLAAAVGIFLGPLEVSG
ncbi:MAG: glycosyltransferase 2 family protein, partial [Chloroflexia bacterium]|nr:glycosyltransferase 2 family protein [Chloroflexia bacterium]